MNEASPVTPSAAGRFEDIWKEALKQYKEHTATSLRYAITDVDTPDNLLRLVAYEHGAFTDYREREEKLRSAVRPVVGIVHQLSEILGEGLLAKCPPARANSAAIRILLKTTQNGHSYDAVIEVFDCLQIFLGRLVVRLENRITHVVRTIIVQFLAQLLATLGLVTKLLKHGRLGFYFRRLLRRKNDILELMTRLERLSQQEVSLVPVLTLTAVNAALGTLRTMILSGQKDADVEEAVLDTLEEELRRHKVVDLRRELGRELYDQSEGAEAARHRAFIRQIQNWLSVPDSSSNHRRACDTRDIETCQWFVSSPTFRQWMSERSYLWVHGPLGSGKTILCSAAIEAAKTECPTGSAIIYFYFDFSDKEKQSIRNLLASLVMQLIWLCTSPPAAVQRLYETCRRGLDQPDIYSLASTLRETSRLFSHTYVVIDALDECPPHNRDMLLRFLQCLAEPPLDHVHVLVTSRPEPDISAWLLTTQWDGIDLKDTLIHRDIEVYIRNRLHSEPCLGRWGERGRDLIETAMITGAHGMFRWVACQLDELRKCLSTISELKKALADLPPTLSQTYKRILGSIAPRHLKVAARILQWILFSQRPLTLREVATVAAIPEDDEEEYDSDDELRDEHDVLVICSGLLIAMPITELDRRNLPSEPLTRLAYEYNDNTFLVQLAHLSVKEFLLSECSPELCPIVKSPAIHAVITQSCLAIFLHILQSQRPQLVHLEIWKHLTKSFPLVPYAVQYWSFHSDLSKSATTPRITHTLRDVFDPNGTLLAQWTVLFYNVHVWGRAKEHQALYYASYEGLEDIAAWLLAEKGADVNFPGGARGTALHAASMRGHCRLVEFLLQRGADIRKEVGYMTALHVAAEHGQEEVVRILLSHGADIDAGRDREGTALYFASRDGHRAVARLLLDHGADVQAGNARETPLHAAAYRGRENIVDALLERGADPDARNFKGNAALHLALEAGHLKVVHRLFAQGYPLGSETLSDAMAQLAATEFATFVRRRLDAAAAVDDAVGAGRCSLLYMAAGSGGKDVVDMLLKRGAHPDSRGYYARWVADGSRETVESNALHAASRSFVAEMSDARRRDREAVIRLLVRHGADVDALEDGLTPLQVATERGDRALVAVLLELRADPDARASRKRAPLHIAIKRDRETLYAEIVRLLLENGADANAPGADGSPPLHVAAELGQPRLMELLLRHGADVDRRSAQGTALHVAVTRDWRGGRCEEVVRILIDHGADVISEDENGCRPLSLVTARLHGRRIRELLVGAASGSATQRT